VNTIVAVARSGREPEQELRTGYQIKFDASYSAYRKLENPMRVQLYEGIFIVVGETMRTAKRRCGRKETANQNYR
jgi:hypothetical protein